MRISRGADCNTIGVGVKPSWITKQLFSKLKVIAISHCNSVNQLIIKMENL